MIYYSTLYSKSVNSVELEKNILRLGGRGGGMRRGGIPPDELDRNSFHSLLS